MKHRAFAPALGALAAILMAAGLPSYASAADPSGIWAKEDGSAKMEVRVRPWHLQQDRLAEGP
jgi:hypothetical protein